MKFRVIAKKVNLIKDAIVNLPLQSNNFFYLYYQQNLKKHYLILKWGSKNSFLVWSWKFQTYWKGPQLNLYY